MSATALATVTALIAGLFLGVVSAWPELRQVRAELASSLRLAEHDPLTGLPNRAAAQRHFQLQAAASRAPAAVLLDLNNFKTVNDTWGHQAGDAVLTTIATRLVDACAPIGGLASRLAGDEFVLLLLPTDPPTVVNHVDAILDRLSEPITFVINNTLTATVAPSASAGIALPKPGSTWTDSLREADIALYHAKSRPELAVLYTIGMRQPPLPDVRHGPRFRDQNTNNR